MNKKPLLILTILLAAATAILRTLQYVHAYEPETGLFDSASGYTAALNVVSLLSAVIFIILAVWLSRSKKSPSQDPPGKIPFIGSAALLILTVLNFILILFSLTSGIIPTVSEFVFDLCVVCLIIYALMMCAYISRKKADGLELFSLIPVFAFVLYLISSFVSITEMSTSQNYYLLILSICALILFFYYDAKGLNLQKRRNTAGIFGLLAVIYLCGQYIPMLIVPSLAFSGFSLSADVLIGLALIIFAFTYAYYLLDQ